MTNTKIKKGNEIDIDRDICQKILLKDNLIPLIYFCTRILLSDKQPILVI